jgi:acyl carrier protein
MKIEKLHIELAAILEVDKLDESFELRSFITWDSLAILSVIVFAEDEFGVRLTQKELFECQRILDLYNLVIKRVESKN